MHARGGTGVQDSVTLGNSHVSYDMLPLSMQGLYIAYVCKSIAPFCSPSTWPSQNLCRTAPADSTAHLAVASQRVFDNVCELGRAERYVVPPFAGKRQADL